MNDIKKSITVKIPKAIKDLRIEHLKAFDLIEETKEWTITKKIKLISIFCNMEEKLLRTSDVKSLIKLFDKIMSILASYEKKELPLIIEVEGKEFELQSDFSKLPVGWFIDASGVDFKQTPELLPAFCYIEKGRKYAEIDENKNILNPLKGRAELFKKYMPLDTFLDLSSFFLLKQKLYSMYFTAIKDQAKKQSESLKSSTGNT